MLAIGKQYHTGDLVPRRLVKNGRDRVPDARRAATRRFRLRELRCFGINRQRRHRRAEGEVADIARILERGHQRIRAVGNRGLRQFKPARLVQGLPDFRCDGLLFHHIARGPCRTRKLLLRFEGPRGQIHAVRVVEEHDKLCPLLYLLVDLEIRPREHQDKNGQDEYTGGRKDKAQPEANGHQIPFLAPVHQVAERHQQREPYPKQPGRLEDKLRILQTLKDLAGDANRLE